MAAKRKRARVLTLEGLQKLQVQIRQQELADNDGNRYSREKLGELTGLDPKTVTKVLDQSGSDRSVLKRCFESFGLVLEANDYYSASDTQQRSTDQMIDSSFVGREEALADLNALVNQGAKIIVIQARGGTGKTTLARRYLQQEFNIVLEFPIARETKDIASIESLLEEKLRQLGEDPGREFLISLDRLKRKLQLENIGVLIDNLEPALNSKGKFVASHRRYVELLRVLSDPAVKSTTLITTRERLRESSLTIHNYSLKGLNIEAWNYFFQTRLLSLETNALASLHHAYGGNAKAMEIVSSVIAEDFSGKTEIYWKENRDDLLIERDLEDLVREQFERLQKLDSDAFKLLCRMGCYRYQDVSTITLAGLFALLWDIPKNQHKRLIKSLKDRSLIENRETLYWLHPVIRAEAISYLREGIDFEITNHKIAEFWTESIQSIDNIGEALIALESFYHYFEVQNYDKASNVILLKRPNKWDREEDLTRSLHRLGLLRQANYALDKIVNHVDLHQKIHLLNALGDTFWRLGQIRKAIDFHETSKQIADDLNERYAYVRSILQIGICKTDLLELEDARDCFQQSLKLADIAKFPRAKLISFYYLAFIDAYDLSEDTKSKTLKLLSEAEETYNLFSAENNMTAQQRGYGLIFIGMAYKSFKCLERSLSFLQKAIQFSQESQSTQIEAKAKYSLAEIYRIQGELDKSLEMVLESIELLEKLEADCDLAEAYYQAGLTYKEKGDYTCAETSFRKAIELFYAVEAPRQIEKVKRFITGEYEIS
ncbi:tetratricopeptide repeat protein [Leptothoe spongobia]|uniref:Tetratricopeptide repeat protein n=1 Tax=Leptothoe spongobia TAU-MAC 1115 TaxID=1967444 RepID=A0A947GKJ2_9CYAN|nr:tetratricopeptide repeat protein [Leptothoe spongobia]MBT9316452.1 tetratricopeptide repeat protein [Leptothoe spongobia TAU-MAC 1115]